MRATSREPTAPRVGKHWGLSYALFLPTGEPSAAVVVLHGAGSAKENHFDFARLCSEAGMAALAFDARGHGRSEGALGASAVDDVVVMCALVRNVAPQVALRGSSLGGWLAIHGAATDGGVSAVVAICPAPEYLLRRGLRSGELDGFEVDRGAVDPLLEKLDLTDAARRLGPETALLLLHAHGDEQVPYTASEELYAAAQEPKRLIVFPGGHHRSLQHDLEVQNLAVKFIAEHAARGG